MIKLFAFSAILYLAISCTNDRKTVARSTNEAIEEAKDLSVFLNKPLKGSGESGIAGNYSHWNFVLKDSNEVVLLRTYVWDRRPDTKNDSQFFFSVQESDTFDYELVPDFSLIASGCDKPRHEFLFSDSAAIEIDSVSLNRLRGGIFRITSEFGFDTSFVASQPQHIFRTLLKNGELDTSDFIIGYTPLEGAKIQPFTLVGGDRCGTYIIDYYAGERYYLNLKNQSLELIIDKSSRYGKTYFDTVPLR